MNSNRRKHDRCSHKPGRPMVWLHDARSAQTLSELYRMVRRDVDWSADGKAFTANCFYCGAPAALVVQIKPEAKRRSKRRRRRPAA